MSAPVRLLRLAAAWTLSLIALQGPFPKQALAISSRTLIAPTGAAVGDLLGHSVGTAGDVNGDGYADLVVGAPGNDAAGTGAGRAYIYYGGPGADAEPDVTLTGETAFDGFGHSVGTAGDVNGDGYADVIIGAIWSDAAGVDAGRAYIYFGGPTADAVADRVLDGAEPSEVFGYSVAAAGDVNGDGYADVIVGAIGNDTVGADGGIAYVHCGGSGAGSFGGLSVLGESAGDYFGSSVAAAGDVNGDGYDDFIVGASGNDAGGAEAGRAYVYYGGGPLDPIADLTLTGEAAGDNFGASVGAPGDVNGDGYSDLLVGATLNDAGGTDAGRAYLYRGGPAPDPVPDMTLTGAAAGDQLGISLGAAGDVNGDGSADVIVGAHGNDGGGASAGRAYVYFGGEQTDALADLTLTGAAAGDQFGYSVGTAGDVNGDGFADVIVGARFEDAGGSDAGRAYITVIYPFHVLSPNGGEQWVAGTPATVRWLGKDPADLAISLDGGITYTTIATRVGGAEENEWTLAAPAVTPLGKIRVVDSGEAASRSNSDASDGTFRIVAAVRPSAAASRRHRTFLGAAVGDQLGHSVSTAGDVNGDGYADMVVGARFHDAAFVNSGRVDVYFGGPGCDAIADWSLTGGGAGDQFGYSVRTAGDVNGDGSADLVVGANSSDAGGVDAGQAYVFLGGLSPDPVPDLTFTGAAAGDLFGTSGSSAGDVNGDGYGDIIVGAHWNDAGGVNAGRAYVFYGGPATDTVADLVLTGAAPNDLFGASVGAAGDVNGDGYADVIVGAIFHDARAPDAGRAYVYYGGKEADAVADLVLTGAAMNDHFGSSVAAAGDVNGDGFDDVIVGAPENDAGGADAGRAYLYFGGPNVDAFPDLMLTGLPGESFGSSAGAAGDVNRDGYGDVIVGAFRSAAAGPEAGRAYVYYGGPAPDAVPDHVLTGDATGDRFGVSVDSAGDVNGDGFADVIVGAYWSDAAGPDAGAAYLFDMNRYHLVAPIGAETWPVGALRDVRWLGAEPADIRLSVDGGAEELVLQSGVGGKDLNAVSIRVPHLPSKFARVRITPSDPMVGGGDRSDSLFTIQTSVALLSLLAAPAPEGGSGSVISWNSDPGPEDLAGYRLERSGATGGWTTLVSLTRETIHTDPSGGPGSRYRLFAINGFGEELWLGEAAVRPRAALAAWPLPFRGGALTVSFAAAGGLGAGSANTDVSVFDVQGRLVKRLVRGPLPQGYHLAAWDGRDERGREVASGAYFVRARSGGETRALRVSVLR